jgi:hypothetical protein
MENHLAGSCEPASFVSIRVHVCPDRGIRGAALYVNSDPAVRSSVFTPRTSVS